MLKKFFLIFVLCLTLTACSSESETIDGFWMAENGDTISFNTDGKAIIDGIAYDYSIYGENNLSISLLGFADEYCFDLDEDTLTLTHLSSKISQMFYRDEETQTKIQEALSQLAAEEAEQERIQQEVQDQIDAEEQAKKEYENFVKSLKNRISTIDSEISYIHDWISNTEDWITDAEAWIEEEQGYIKEAEETIAEVQKSGDTLADEQVAHLREGQSLNYENINRYNEDITGYRNEIFQYQQDIAALKAEKEEIIAELKELGEF